MPWELGKYVELVQSMVLDPSFSSVVPVFMVSLVNEFLSLLPLGFIFASQLAFLDGPLTAELASRLFIYIALPVGVGVGIGSLLIYFLSYFGGRPVIERFGKYFRVRWHDVERMEKRLEESRYDEMLFLALRCTPFFPNVPVTIASGILRMKLFPFIVLTAAGTTIRIMFMFILAALGFGSLF